jgi:hypothetical protein
MRRWVDRDNGTEGVVIDLIGDMDQIHTQPDLGQKAEQPNTCIHFVSTRMSEVLQPLDSRVGEGYGKSRASNAGAREFRQKIDAVQLRHRVLTILCCHQLTFLQLQLL